jgi:Tol biopolymer transport system component
MAIEGQGPAAIRAEFVACQKDELLGTRQITINPWNNQNPEWSPDGLQLAFASDRKGGWERYTRRPAPGSWAGRPGTMDTRRTRSPAGSASFEPSWLVLRPPQRREAGVKRPAGNAENGEEAPEKKSRQWLNVPPLDPDQGPKKGRVQAR